MKLIILSGILSLGMSAFFEPLSLSICSGNQSGCVPPYRKTCYRDQNGKILQFQNECDACRQVGSGKVIKSFHSNVEGFYLTYAKQCINWK